MRLPFRQGGLEKLGREGGSRTHEMADSKSAALGHLATSHQKSFGAQSRTRTGKLAQRFLRPSCLPISSPGHTVRFLQQKWCTGGIPTSQPSRYERDAPPLSYQCQPTSTASSIYAIYGRPSSLSRVFSGHSRW